MENALVGGVYGLINLSNKKFHLILHLFIKEITLGEPQTDIRNRVYMVKILQCFLEINLGILTP